MLQLPDSGFSLSILALFVFLRCHFKKRVFLFENLLEVFGIVLGIRKQEPKV